MRRWTIMLGIFALIVVILSTNNTWMNNRTDYLQYNQENISTLSWENIPSYSNNDYLQYLLNHSVQLATTDISISANTYVNTNGTVSLLNDYQSRDNVVYMGEDASITWKFNVPTEGLYQIYLDYYPTEGKSSSIERSIKINDELPFYGADNIMFPRYFANATEIKQDLNGNDIRPSQIEKPMWSLFPVRDRSGYESDPYLFYFHEGINTLTLDSVREPMVIDKIYLTKPVVLPNYDDVIGTYVDAIRANENDLFFIQAEHHLYSTSPTLYPLNDKTSPQTMPSSATKSVLNTIGGNNWRIAGDKIVWEFEVEKSALYQISMRIKQKTAVGMNVYRNIYIDGEIPFQELKDYPFVHDSDWRIQTLGTEEEPFMFYLEEGRHEIAMEVSLGEYGPLISRIQTSISNLNKLYREILVYTGPEPDQYRDYQLTERVDNLVGRLENEREELTEIRDEIIAISGKTSEKTGILDTVLLQLDDFIEKPREIHRNLGSFNGNISSLGTLVLMLSAQPLEIDYFMIHGINVEFPKNDATLIKAWTFSLQAFLSTFVTDYSSLGQTTLSETNTSVEVWLSIGRDQANVLRKLIDETFTPQTGIRIDLKLVNGAVLLPATLSGVGPDVAMGLGNSIPVNYAMRNAVYDLSQFDDFDEITSRFYDSAMVPFEYEGGYYALPEQQIWLMMFYRTDIFEELGLTVPETWDDLVRLIPDLQKYNLEFYLPVPITQGSVMNLPPNPVFSTMFYQNDGEFYINNNSESGFYEGKGPEVFERWTRFYTDYSFPVEANFINRFRNGQMPIGITYYNTYNTLSVFAPEIRGKWDFTLVPGTIDIHENGETYIRRETVSTGTATMIMQSAKDKNAAWEYLKWWTSEQTQVQFGREMEGILGAAARYPTANVEAMKQLPWTVDELNILLEQWGWVRGIPEVPGGYMTGRHLDNAFRRVYEEKVNPKETLYDYVQIINDEIAKKRREFGLDDWE